MAFLAALWLPILVAAILVFVASSILHMAIPIHKSDYKKLGEEDKLLDQMREMAIGPGEYMFPCPASMNDMGSPEMIEKYNKGPVGYMVVSQNGPPPIHKSLVWWFAYSLLLGIFVAYLSWLVLDPGANYMRVFRISGTIAVLGYAVPYCTDSIWKSVPWSTTLKYVFDGIVYGLVTAGSFAWLWPDA